MPDVTGLDLLRLVRADDRLASLPVVMMSAQEHGTVVLACIRAGAEAYLLKVGAVAYAYMRIACVGGGGGRAGAAFDWGMGR